jgi:acyl phosphate:glycerol-3-phosphate acyltransferase
MVGNVFGFDPRAVGSGNIGMTNVARAGGGSAAAITFIGDLAKGLFPVLVARTVLGGDAVPVLALVGFATFAGSIASIFLRFKGGRGVSTSLGVWLGLAPAPIGIVLLVFATLVASTRVMSLASIGAAVSLPPAVAAVGCPRPYILLAILMSGLVILRHRENIKRLMNGEEPKIGGGKGEQTR